MKTMVAGVLNVIRSPNLRVDLFEVVLLHENFSSLTAGARRDEPVGFHHVDEPGGTAETNPQATLQIRDRSLTAADNDARGLVVEVVLLEVELAASFLFLGSDRLVVGRFALLTKEAREPSA